MKKSGSCWLKAARATVVVISGVTAGCGGIDTPNLEPDKFYWVYDSCENSKEGGCVDAEENRAICLSEDLPIGFDYKREAREARLTYGRSDGLTLLENRQIISTVFSWNAKEAQCEFLVTVGGLVNGNSLEAAYRFRVNSWNLSESGLVLATGSLVVSY